MSVNEIEILPDKILESAKKLGSAKQGKGRESLNPKSIFMSTKIYVIAFNRYELKQST